MKSNFDFLNPYWPALAQTGADAEIYAGAPVPAWTNCVSLQSAWPRRSR